MSAQHRAKVNVWASVSRADITPPIGIAHGNWGAAVHERAEGVDAPLFVTVLAIRSMGEPALIADFDLLFIGNDLAKRLRAQISEATGVAPERIRLSASHTHSGPTLGSQTWIKQGVEFVEPYVGALVDKATGCAWRAVRTLRPATVGAGRGSCDANINRRLRLDDGRVVVGQNPEGFVDRELIAVRIDGEDGNPIAHLVNYACHPTIMSYANRLITPDYPGPLRETVERALGGHCLFLQGAAGNLASVEDLSNDPASYRRIGRRVGHRAAEILTAIETRPLERRLKRVLHSGADLAVYEHREIPRADAEVTVLERTVPLPVGVRLDIDRVQAELDARREHLERLRRDGAPDEAIRNAAFAARRAYIQLGRAKSIAGKESIPLPVQVITLGDIALLSAPVEIFAELGARIKANSPFPVTCVSGYSNGANSYLPTADAYELGGYEVEITPYAPGAGDVFVQGALALLEEARRTQTPESGP